MGRKDHLKDATAQGLQLIVIGIGVRVFPEINLYFPITRLRGSPLVSEFTVVSAVLPCDEKPVMGNKGNNLEVIIYTSYFGHDTVCQLSHKDHQMAVGSKEISEHFSTSVRSEEQYSIGGYLLSSFQGNFFQISLLKTNFD